MGALDWIGRRLLWTFVLVLLSASFQANGSTDLCALHALRIQQVQNDPALSPFVEAAGLITRRGSSGHRVMLEAIADSRVADAHRIWRIPRPALEGWIEDLQNVQDHFRLPDLDRGFNERASAAFRARRELYVAEFQSRMDAAQQILVTETTPDLYLGPDDWRTVVRLIGARPMSIELRLGRLRHDAASLSDANRVDPFSDRVMRAFVGRLQPALTVFPFWAAMGPEFFALLSHLSVGAVEATPQTQFIRNTDARSAIANLDHDLTHLETQLLDRLTLEQRDRRLQSLRQVMVRLERLPAKDRPIALEYLLWFSSAVWRDGRPLPVEYDIAPAMVTMNAHDWIRAAYELEMSPEIHGGINPIATEIQRIIDNGPYPNMNNAILQRVHPGGFAPTAQAVRDVVRPMLEQMLRD